jgi:hypothetical protein
LVWLFGKGHRDVVLENLALRQQISIYQRKQKRPRLTRGDRWFWMTVSVMWKNWRQALLIVHPDTVVRWQRERFRRHWGGLSSKPGRIGRPPIKRDTISFWRTTGHGSRQSCKPQPKLSQRAEDTYRPNAHAGGKLVKIFIAFANRLKRDRQKVGLRSESGKRWKRLNYRRGQSEPESQMVLNDFSKGL